MNDADDINNKNNQSSELFDTEVLSEGTTNKEVMVPDKMTVTKQPWKKIYEVIDEAYF